ncbi:MAG: hypothetical protein ACRDRI_15955 [Pseudonocardiaceae bacterium]
MQVVKFGGEVLGEQCWNGGEYGTKQLSDKVTSGTVFFVKAKKRGSGPNNDWGGELIY